MSEATERQAVPLNSIPQRQNEEQFLRLLRARSRVYQRARVLQVMQLLGVVLLPVVMSIVGLIWPGSGPAIALTSLIIAVADTGWLDRAQRREIKTSAVISEEFDCELLEIPWNDPLVGRRIAPEDLKQAALSWRRGDDKLGNWYPEEVGNAPLSIARALCQRTNCWYDQSLRQLYGSQLLLVVAGVFGVLLFVSVVVGSSVREWIAGVLTPAAPPLIWCLREYFRQQDAIGMARDAQVRAEDLCQAFSRGETEQAVTRSRQVQDAIYIRRSSSPLIFPFLYSRRRPQMEQLMRSGASDSLTRFEQ